LCFLYPLHTCIRLPSTCRPYDFQKQRNQLSDEKPEDPSKQWESTEKFPNAEKSEYNQLTNEKPEEGFKLYNGTAKQWERTNKLPNNTNIPPKNISQANDIGNNQPPEAKITDFPSIQSYIYETSKIFITANEDDC